MCDVEKIHVSDFRVNGPRVCGPPLTWVWVGELDVGDVDDLFATWRSILEEQPRYVVIDMAEVTFLDCRVLSFLVVARREAAQLFLRSVSPWVQQLLALVQLGDLVPPLEPEPLTTSAA